MPLVEAKCTSCGANLKVNSGSEASNCQFCGAAFIIEKAINHYKITNEIRDSVVNIYSGDYKSADNYYEKGNALTKIGDYTTGMQVFTSMTRNFPGDWRGWWGLVLCGTKSGLSYPAMPQVPFWYKSARKLAPEQDFIPFAQWYDVYCRNAARTQIESEITKIRERLNRHFSDILKTESYIADLNSFILEKALDLIKKIAGVPIIVLSLYFFGYVGIYQTIKANVFEFEQILIMTFSILLLVAFFNISVSYYKKNPLQRKISSFNILFSQIRQTKADISLIQSEIGREEQLLFGGPAGIEQDIYQTMIAEIR
jgi:hypothetical protein